MPNTNKLDNLSKTVRASECSNCPQWAHITRGGQYISHSVEHLFTCHCAKY